MGPRQTGNRKKAAEDFREWLVQRRDQVGIRSDAELAQRAGVAASTLSMIGIDGRLPSAKVAIRLAAALAGDRPPAEFTREMLERAQHSAVFPDSESIWDRVTQSGSINVGVVDYEPFVFRTPEIGGFAIELFNHVSALLNKRPNYIRFPLGELETRIRERHVDVVVSGLFPTFHRRTFMSFTRPLPFIRVPLTALCHPSLSVSAADVLSWTEPTSPTADAHIVVVKGEVGDEFIKVFLRAVNRDDATRVTRLDSFDPSDIYETLVANPRNLLIADHATCSAVSKRAAPHTLQFLPAAAGHERQRRTGAPDVGPPAMLARYVVAFGAPPERSDEWIAKLNLAMDSLLSEGIEIVKTLYRRYLGMPRAEFSNFLVEAPDEDPSAPLHAQKAFEPVLGPLSREKVK